MKRILSTIAVGLALACMMNGCAAPTAAQTEQAIQTAVFGYQSLTAGRMAVLASFQQGFISLDAAKEQLHRQDGVRIALDTGVIFGGIAVPAANLERLVSLKKADDEARALLEMAIAPKI